jgi:hypothetical protein
MQLSGLEGNKASVIIICFLCLVFVVLKYLGVLCIFGHVLAGFF